MPRRRGNVAPINKSQLQYTNKMTHIHHTWYNKHAHIFRSDGRIVRATMKELVFDNGAIYIKTEFTDGKGLLQTKDTSPITIAALQVLWINVDVVSDVELPEDFETVTTFIAPRECDRLPPLTISMQKTPSLTCLLLQVNHFLGLSSSMTTVLPPVASVLIRPPRRRTARRRTVKSSVGSSADP